MNTDSKASVMIACGGTGGHFFPGLAMAHALGRRGSDVVLLLSRKAIDRRLENLAEGFETRTLPALGFSLRRCLSFLLAFHEAQKEADRWFRLKAPHLFLSMGGFSGAPALRAARKHGAVCAIHEANAVPGRANRMLSRLCQEAFVYFPEAAERLVCPTFERTGMPLRDGLGRRDPASSRMALGLKPADPVLLIVGGSQGARFLNQLGMGMINLIRRDMPTLQVLHLAGDEEADACTRAYREAGIRAVVRPFLSEMEMAYGAATAALTRAGAGTLSELAALGVPALLVPYPHAADDHQHANASAFAEVGACRLLRQATADAASAWAELQRLLGDEAARSACQQGLGKWFAPGFADVVADRLYHLMGRTPKIQPDVDREEEGRSWSREDFQPLKRGKEDA